MAKTLAGRIQKAREAAGMSQSDLARACKVSPQAVQQWELGGGIRQKRLEQVAKVLGVRPEVLLFGEGAKSPELTEGNARHDLRNDSHAARPDPAILHEAVTLLLFDLDHGGPRSARSASDLLLDLYHRIAAAGGRLTKAEQWAFEDAARSRKQPGATHGPGKTTTKPRRAG